MLRTKNLITDGTKVGYNNAALQINRIQKVQKDELQEELNKQSTYVEQFNTNMSILNGSVAKLDNAIEFLHLLISSWYS